LSQVSDKKTDLSRPDPQSSGGIPSDGINFGTATNMDCLIDMHQQFDFYDGGGLYLACLGLAQMDSQGNVNVSKFGPKLAGCGGFIDITQTAKKSFSRGPLPHGTLCLQADPGRHGAYRNCARYRSGKRGSGANGL